MALPSNKATAVEQDSALDSFPDAMVDIDDFVADESDTLLSDDNGRPERFASSAELRRKIEERLELKRLKDELGFDDDF